MNLCWFFFAVYFHSHTFAFNGPRFYSNRWKWTKVAKVAPWNIFDTSITNKKKKKNGPKVKMAFCTFHLLLFREEKQKLHLVLLFFSFKKNWPLVTGPFFLFISIESTCTTYLLCICCRNCFSSDEILSEIFTFHLRVPLIF